MATILNVWRQIQIQKLSLLSFYAFLFEEHSNEISSRSHLKQQSDILFALVWRAVAPTRRTRMDQ